MPVQINGFTTANIAEVEANTKALRTTLRPIDIGALGWYSFSMATGALTGLSANTQLFSFRNASTNVYLIKRLLFGWVTTTAFGAAQNVDHQLFIARGFTANQGGGAAATVTGNNGKLRTSFATTGISGSSGDFRISTTAALTGSSFTKDTQSVAACGAWSGAIGSGLSPIHLIQPVAGEYPIVLAQNEGLVLDNITAMGATGVLKCYVTCEWLEIASY